MREFILLISQGDALTLSEKFNINDAAFDEITEILDGYGVEINEWHPPVTDQYRRDSIFQMHEPQVLGVEENFWAKGKPQEPLLHAEVSFSADQPIFRFKYIGS